MASEKRSLLLELLAKDKTAAATRSAADNLDGVADAAKGADKATEKLGKSGKTAAQHVEALDREIESCEKELKQLAVAFREAETVADRADLSKAIRRTESDLKNLSKARGQLKDLIPDVADVEPGKLAALGSKLGTSLGSSMGMTAGLVAAPLILSAVGGAISAGAGAGAIGAGIGLAIAKDPAIKAAGKELGTTLFDNATARARTAFHDPIMDILDDLGDHGEKVVDQWGDAFDKLAPAVEPFVDTVAGAVADLSGTIAGIAGDSGPALKALGDGFEAVADSVGGALERITGDSERNADALEALLVTTSAAIDLFGLLAEGVMELAEPLIAVYNAGKSAGEGIGELAIAAGIAEGPTHKLRGLNIEAADAMNQAATSAYDQASALKSLADTQKALADPTFALVKAQDDLAKAQSEVNKAEEKHGKTSPEYRAALHSATEAALALQSAAGEVATTSTGRLDPALKATLQTAGVTAETISALESEFVSAKKAGDKFARTYTAKVDVLGLAAAKATAKRISATLAAIKDENVNINYQVNGVNSSRLRSNIDKNREFGGPVKQGHAYVVGEKRAEVFVPDRDGKILPSVEQYQRAVGMQPAAAMPSSPGGGVAGLEISFNFGPSDFGQLLVKTVRTQPAVRSALTGLLAVTT